MPITERGVRAVEVRKSLSLTIVALFTAVGEPLDPLHYAVPVFGESHLAAYQAGRPTKLNSVSETGRNSPDSSRESANNLSCLCEITSLYRPVPFASYTTDREAIEHLALSLFIKQNADHRGEEFFMRP